MILNKMLSKIHFFYKFLLKTATEKLHFRRGNYTILNLFLKIPSNLQKIFNMIHSSKF